MSVLQLTITYIAVAVVVGKTPTDNRACEDPYLVQCSVELVNEDAK